MKINYAKISLSVSLLGIGNFLIFVLLVLLALFLVLCMDLDLLYPSQAGNIVKVLSSFTGKILVTILPHKEAYRQSQSSYLQYPDNLTLIYSCTFLISTKLYKRPCSTNIMIILKQLKIQFILFLMWRQFYSRNLMSVPYYF